MIRVACLAAVVAAILATGPASALQLSPLDFASLGTLSATNDLVVNTDTLQLSGGAWFTGVQDSTSGAAVFTFDTIQVANISVIGSNPVVFLSKGDAVFSGNAATSNSGGLQIAAVGTVSVTSGASIAVLNGSTLSIFAQDLFLDRGTSVVSGGNQILATPQGLVPESPVVTAGRVSISSGSGTNLFHSFDAFNVRSGEVQLFSSNIGLGGGTLTGAILVPESNGEPVIVGVASVPEASTVLLVASGLSGIACLRRRI